MFGQKMCRIKKWKIEGNNFLHLRWDMHSGLSKDKLEIIVAIMKKIWDRRNEFIFENKFTSPSEIVQWAVTGLGDFHEAKKMKRERQTGEEPNRRQWGWRKLVGNT